jgi:hypothetical protein
VLLRFKCNQFHQIGSLIEWVLRFGKTISSKLNNAQEVEDTAPDASTKNEEGLTKEGAIKKEHPSEFYDGPGDHDRGDIGDSGMEVVGAGEDSNKMNLETVE